MEDFTKATGYLELVLTDENGVEKHRSTVPNLVVTTGKAYIASRMADDTTPLMSHLALGTSSIAPAAANTTLVAQIAISALSVQTSALNVSTFTASFAPGVATGAITEAGIFNAASAGTMLCRTVFAVINKNVNDTLTISWNISIN